MTSSTDLLARSDVESRRFGLEVFRGTFAEEVPAKAVVAEILRDTVDVAILRIPVSAASSAAAYFESRGFPVISADTLVYYHLALEEAEPAPLRNADLEFDLLDSSNQGALDDMVEAIFGGYVNHYSANPLLQAGLLPGYVEWVRSFAGDQPDRFGWLVRRGGQPVAFATCSRHGEVGEGVLYGVLPEAAGGGVYGDLIRFTQTALRDRGCRTMKVSTQVQNFAVQRVWSREGFVMREAFATVHVNALLSASVVPKRTLTWSVSHDDVEAFGAASGDRNPVHFDDAAARTLGFEERIAHGIIANAFLSKFYGTEFPGAGTLFAAYRYQFSRPIYCGRDYTVEISFPFHDPDTGRWRSLARVFDSSGTPCLLAFSDLVNREVRP